MTADTPAKEPAPLVCLACWHRFTPQQATRQLAPGLFVACLACPECGCGDLDFVGRHHRHPGEASH